jgi:general secretion pathway protein I
MMTLPTGRRRTGGFTLLEVLVAVAVFAIGVTAVLQGFQVCMHAMERARDVLVCSRLASQRLDDLRLMSRSGETPKSSGGTFDDPFEAYAWDVSLREASVGGDGIGDGEGELLAVVVRVWRGQEAYGVELESHLFVAGEGDDER